MLSGALREVGAVESDLIVITALKPGETWRQPEAPWERTDGEFGYGGPLFDYDSLLPEGVVLMGVEGDPELRNE
jgi:hypothetical protein